ncbi:hypothetical protein UY3_08411 [Chelonia mydas]|uniref:Uncharacterized protein n=1 Tax=Chelonia mydas TaxID=8469 RepID=M7BFQ6_CHEMY|nr:hypothetical protein UY3_08411 [Chelonia mydas]
MKRHVLYYCKIMGFNGNIHSWATGEWRLLTESPALLPRSKDDNTIPGHPDFCTAAAGGSAFRAALPASSRCSPAAQLRRQRCSQQQCRSGSDVGGILKACPKYAVSTVCIR